MLSNAARGRAMFTAALTLAACLLEDDYEPRYLQANREYPVPRGEVKLEDWSRALAEARCSFLERCNHYGLQGRFYRNEPCLDYFRAFYEDTLELPALVKQGHVTWDGAEFGRCVSHMARMNCEQYWWPRACYEGRGTLPEGADCGHDAECGLELFCQYDDACNGRCQRRLPRGERCQHRLQCEEGLACMDIVEDSEGSWGSCRRPLKRGAECDDSDSEACGPSMTCETWYGYDHTGSCEPREPGWNAPWQAHRGALCDSSTVCLDATECRPVDIYDAGEPYAPPRCVDAIAPGGRCLRADGVVLSACAEGSYCEASADLEYGECVPRLAQDSACTGSDPHECLEGLACDPTALTCQPRRRALRGEPCESYQDCYSEECHDGGCVTAFCPWAP